MTKPGKQGRAKADKAKDRKATVKVLMDGALKVYAPVKGLVKDGELAADLVSTVQPDVLALGIAPEELEGLRKLIKKLRAKKKYEPSLSNIDEAYARHLSKFGEVDAPPPCFTYPLEAADELKIPVVALDLDNETHTDIYVKNVVFTDLLRQSMRFRWIRRKKFAIKKPEEFALAWDAILNKARGFRTVEDAREKCMAKGLQQLFDKNAGVKVLAIIEIERVDGVLVRFLHPTIKRPSRKKEE